MKIHGTAGRARQIVDELTSRTLHETSSRQFGTGNQTSATPVIKKARDEFFQKETQVRMHRLQKGMRQHGLFGVTIVCVFLAIFFMMFFRHR